MAIFELQGPDGAIYEVDAPDEAAAVGAFQQMLAPQQPKERPQSQVLMDQYEAAVAAGNDAEADRLLKEATYAATQDGSAPDSVTYNPNTGRMVDLDLKQDPVLFGGRGGAVLQGGGQGLGFGAFDEAVGALHGVTGGGTYQQNYDYARDVMRHDLQRSREQYPITTIGAEVLGGVGSGLGATSAVPAARTMAGTMGQNIGLGAGLGALYGFGAGEGDGRAKNALKQGEVGGAAGALAQPLAWAVRTGWNALANAGRNVMPSASPVSVGNALNAALKGSGQSSDEVVNALKTASADGQDVFRLADALGISGQRSLSGAVRQGGEAKRIASEFLDTRQAGQGERLSRLVSDALGIDDTANATRATMTAARGRAADAAYDAARRGAGPVDIRGALSVIDDRIGGMQGSGIRGDGIDAKLSGYRSRLASQPGGPAHPGASSVELSDFDRVLGVKQAIQDDIGTAIRAGRNNEARELGRVVNALDEALEASSAGYRSANDAFRTASREIDQIDAGIAASRPGRRAADTVAEYGGLQSDAQRGAYRAGYGNEVLGRIERAAEGVNKARPLTSQKSAEELAAMARDPALLSRAIGRENTMFQTRNMALGGSQTADNLMDIAGTNALARIPTTAMGVLDAGLGAVNSLARGQNAATREAIVRALLSSGDEAATALAGAVARGEQLTRQQIALMRTLLVGGQQAGGQVAR